MASIAGRSHAKSIADDPASTSLPMIHMQAPPRTPKWCYQLLTRWIRGGDYVETVWRLCGDAGSPSSRARLSTGASRFLAAWRCSTPTPAAQVADVCVGLYGLDADRQKCAACVPERAGTLETRAGRSSGWESPRNSSSDRRAVSISHPPESVRTRVNSGGWWATNPAKPSWLSQRILAMCGTARIAAAAAFAPLRAPLAAATALRTAVAAVSISSWSNTGGVEIAAGSARS
jgi:hypothetical protein